MIGRSNNDRITFNKEIIDIIINNNYIPLGIIVDFNNNSTLEFNKIKPSLDMCSGFILQGGSDFYDIDIKITKYLYEINKPTLGICLGMQTMAMAFNGIMMDINDHNKKDKYVHEIIIDKNSKLYEIIKKDKIKVNSRHNSYIYNTSLQISAKNDIIEAIEDRNKLFFIGVQWHPESIITDNNSILLFKSFFKSIN